MEQLYKVDIELIQRDGRAFIVKANLKSGLLLPGPGYPKSEATEIAKRLLRDHHNMPNNIPKQKKEVLQKKRR